MREGHVSQTINPMIGLPLSFLAVVVITFNLYITALWHMIPTAQCAQMDRWGRQWPVIHCILGPPNQR
jgi:hypothetical protein